MAKRHHNALGEEQENHGVKLYHVKKWWEQIKESEKEREQKMG